MTQDLSPKILNALSQLDPENNDHWTNDGLPNTGVVQRIASDQTIRRPDIQTARPGFDRESAKAAAVAAASQGPADFEETAATSIPVVGAPAPAVAVDADGGTTLAPVNGVPAAESDTVEVTTAQLRGVLDKRVHDAEMKVAKGRKMEAEGVGMIADGLKELSVARASFHKYFPPTTQAENTRAYLDASNAERAARAERAAERGYAPGPASTLDAARRTGNTRGFDAKGAHRGPGGVQAFSRKEAQSMGLVVPGSPAALARSAPVLGGGVRPGVKA